MAIASSSVICQNRVLSSSAFPSVKLSNHRANLQFQSSPQKLFQHIRRLNDGVNLSSPSAAAVAKTALSDVDSPVQHGDPSFNPASTSGWSEFARNISGEWDGYAADFSLEGKPIELPESVVPNAYREWDVKVFDWQTQCPTLAKPEEKSNFMYKLIKLLPTVGCEADAATRYSIDERNVIESVNSSKVVGFAYQSNGCYVAIWEIEDKGGVKELELEHCLINPRDKESRVRIIQGVSVKDGKLELKNVVVFCEQWYGPFRNGEQLGGCAIRDSAFASTAPLDASQVGGSWKGDAKFAKFDSSQNKILQEIVDIDVWNSIRTEDDGLILLPKQLWCSLKPSKDGDDSCSEVGWLLETGHAITSRCIFSSEATLKEISVADEILALEAV